MPVYLEALWNRRFFFLAQIRPEDVLICASWMPGQESHRVSAPCLQTLDFWGWNRLIFDPYFDPLQNDICEYFGIIRWHERRKENAQKRYISTLRGIWCHPLVWAILAGFEIRIPSELLFYVLANQRFAVFFMPKYELLRQSCWSSFCYASLYPSFQLGFYRSCQLYIQQKSADTLIIF